MIITHTSLAISFKVLYLRLTIADLISSDHAGFHTIFIETVNMLVIKLVKSPLYLGT